MERRREGEGPWFGEIERRERKMQRKERWERIRKSQHNRWYKEVKGIGIPSYLKRSWRESRWRRVARFRLGSEMREAWYWEEEEKSVECVEGKEKHGSICGKNVESEK